MPAGPLRVRSRLPAGLDCSRPSCHPTPAGQGGRSSCMAVQDDLGLPQCNYQSVITAGVAL